MGQGWLAKFKGGDYDGQVRSFPAGKEPPEELVMLKTAFGVVSIDGPYWYDEEKRATLPQPLQDGEAACYRINREHMSKLSDEDVADNEHVARGALYELVEV